MWWVSEVGHFGIGAVGAEGLPVGVAAGCLVVGAVCC